MCVLVCVCVCVFMCLQVSRSASGLSGERRIPGSGLPRENDDLSRMIVFSRRETALTLRTLLLNVFFIAITVGDLIVVSMIFFGGL